MLKIPEISDVELVFPANPPLPKWDDIPSEFKKSSNEFAEIAQSLFFNGGKLSDFGLKPKENVDVKKTHRAIAACLQSFDPQHEHKIAGVGYMISEWFEK